MSTSSFGHHSRNSQRLSEWVNNDNALCFNVIICLWGNGNILQNSVVERTHAHTVNSRWRFDLFDEQIMWQQQKQFIAHTAQHRAGKMFEGTRQSDGKWNTKCVFYRKWKKIRRTNWKSWTKNSQSNMKFIFYGAAFFAVILFNLI